MARKLKSRRKRIRAKSKEQLSKIADKLPVTAPDNVENPSAPRITNDSVAEHREEVLSGGRKFLYPLQHSKHKVVIISTGIVILLIMFFIGSTYFLLYRQKSHSDFAYQVTKILPVPIARVNGDFVQYERYLFELRTTLYYMSNYAQEGVDLNSEEGNILVEDTKARAFEKIMLDVIAEQLAEDNGIEVTDEEVEAQILVIRNQGGIGESEEVLKDVLLDFYDWDIDDLRRVVRLQLIRQKLPIELDTEARDKASQAYEKLQSGEDFGKVAEEFSEDELSNQNGGNIKFKLTETDLPVEFLQVAEGLEDGQVSEIIHSPIGYHIIRKNSSDGELIDASHILIRFFNINEFLKQKLDEATVDKYIELPEVQENNSGPQLPEEEFLQ